jgi:acetyl esterase/lipase
VCNTFQPNPEGVPKSRIVTAFVGVRGEAATMRRYNFGRPWLAAMCSFALVHGAGAEPRKLADVEYARVDGQPLQLDLYLPADGSAAPLLVWVHGGGWEAGSKEQMPVGALVDRGFAIASLDFRPASAAPFPGQAHEIKAAIRFLRASAAQYGYRADRIGILGASSGAHLAALVGVTSGHPQLEGQLGDHRGASSTVQAIVAYFGASNLTTILGQSTPFGLRVREPALERLLGGLPDAKAELARLASPVTHVDVSDPPLLLLHGDQDPQMPINQSHELEGAYERAGRDAPFHVVHGAAHGGDAFYDEERIDLVAQFLRKALN